MGGRKEGEGGWEGGSLLTLLDGCIIFELSYTASFMCVCCTACEVGCMHPQVTLQTTDEYKMDSVRPEYHRSTLFLVVACCTMTYCYSLCSGVVGRT